MDLAEIKVNDVKDRKWIERTERIFGITDYEHITVLGERYFVRRSPGVLNYAIWPDVGGCIGYVIIGERADGRIVMDVQTVRGVSLSRENVTVHKAIRLLLDARAS